MSDRLARFRGYMTSLNATDATTALGNGHYVTTPGDVAADRLAARLQLQPAASMAIVGGIGSGKTTQLLVLRDKLEAAGDVRAIYIDVAELVDLAQVRAGVIVALAGQATGRLIADNAPVIARAKQQFDGWVHGQTVVVTVDPHDYEPDMNDLDDLHDRDARVEPRWIPGRVVPPRRPLLPNVLETVEPLRCLRRALGAQHIVLLLDSIDRFSDFKPLSTVVEQDVRALASAGIGVVMATPLRALFGTWRVVLDHFESFEYLPPIDVDHDGGRKFLTRVLRARVPAEGVADDAVADLASLSGGILRDFLMLARQAAEEAYLSGSDRIEVAHARIAADRFGRKHLFGVTPAQLDILQRLRRLREFVPTGDDDLALLVTRRVIEYQRVRVEYALHPTIEPLLKQLAHAA